MADTCFDEEVLLTVVRYKEQVRQGTLKTIPMADIIKEVKVDGSDLAD